MSESQYETFSMNKQRLIHFSVGTDEDWRMRENIKVKTGLFSYKVKLFAIVHRHVSPRENEHQDGAEHADVRRKLVPQQIIIKYQTNPKIKVSFS